MSIDSLARDRVPLRMSLRQRWHLLSGSWSTKDADIVTHQLGKDTIGHGGRPVPSAHFRWRVVNSRDIRMLVR